MDDIEIHLASIELSLTTSRVMTEPWLETPFPNKALCDLAISHVKSIREATAKLHHAKYLFWQRQVLEMPDEIEANRKKIDRLNRRIRRVMDDLQAYLEQLDKSANTAADQLEKYNAGGDQQWQSN